MVSFVTLVDGPVGGRHDGPMAWSILRMRPPFFCASEGESWHHYVDDPGTDPPRYVYGGLCNATDHPVHWRENGAGDCCGGTGFADVAAVPCPNPSCPTRAQVTP